MQGTLKLTQSLRLRKNYLCRLWRHLKQICRKKFILPASKDRRFLPLYEWGVVIINTKRYNQHIIQLSIIHIQGNTEKAKKK